MLRSAGKGQNQKKILTFGACRDLHGRRLRHVNDELRLRKWLSEPEQKRRAEMGDEYREARGDRNMEGWFLGVPAWAEGFKKDGTLKRNARSEKKKTAMCQNWLNARKDRPAPEGAPAWWGCPRGRTCDYAHGEDDLRGIAKVEAKKAAKNKGVKDTSRLDHAIHAYQALSADISDTMGDAVAMGLQRSLSAQAKKRDEELEKQESFLPVDVHGTRKGLRWDSSAWVESLGVEEDVEVTFGPLDASEVVTEGGAAVAIKALPAGVAEVQGMVEFASARVSNIALKSRAWYYEVELISGGLAQIGWAHAGFAASGDATDGVGDNAASWAYDGARQLKWHAGKSEAYGDAWQQGDVIGVFLDVDVGVLSFSRNGATLGPAFLDVDLAAASLYPAVSLEQGEVVRVNIGQAPFQFPPAAPYAPVFNARGDQAATVGAVDVAPLAGAGSGAGAAGGAGGGSGAGVDEDAEEAPGHKRRRVEAEESDAPAPAPVPVAEPVPAPAPAPVAEPVPTPAPVAPAVVLAPSVVLGDVKSVEELVALGLDQLKVELTARGLKCGGTLAERAARLFSLKALRAQTEVPAKLKGPGFPGTWP